MAPLSETLRVAMWCVRDGWNPEGPMAFSENYEFVWSFDLMATAPLSTSKPDPNRPGHRCLDIPGRVRVFTAEAALEYARRKLELPFQIEHDAGEFLTSMLPPVRVFKDGTVWPNDYYLWEKESGRTQAEVVDLFERAVRRAMALERG